MRTTINFDKNWKFNLGDIVAKEPIWGFQKSGTHNQTGARSALDDSSWRTVNLPHDYVMEGTFVPSYEQWSPENVIPEMWSVGNLHTTRGSLQGRVAWYRKTFDSLNTDGKRVFIRFDGIYRDSEIYLNDFFVGRHLSGYTGVTFDITDFLYADKKNVLCVRVDPSKAEGWFYEGGGIYRHVWLITTPLIAIDHHGVFVKSDVDLQKGSAKVMVQTTIRNDADFPSELCVSQIITAPNGEKYNMADIAAEIPVNEVRTVEQTIEIQNVQLWDIDAPNLYTVKTILNSGDILETTFGIRHFHFDKDTGFYLNGRNVKIKGVCCHQDHAGLGSALPDGMQEYRIRKLKEMGCNAYRAAHNPATEELLQVCDRMGMLVMNENRLLSSSSEDLAQLDEMVMSSRNHPSVFLWSLGNEEGKIHFTENGKKIANTMRNHVRALDGTRATTVAVCFWDADSNYRGIENPAVTGILTNSIDVFGFNYFTELWDNFHEAYPEVPVLSSEHTSIPCTRGCRITDNEKCHQSITNPETMSYGAGEAAWKSVRDRDYVAGIFLWTGFDYHGEPSPFGWPAISTQFGVLDLCGFKKDAFYYYKACWDNTPLLHLCADNQVVWSITNCEEVELFVNGKSHGRRKTEKDSIMQWKNIDFPCNLEAIGYIGGQKTAEDVLMRYGKAEKLHAEVDGCFIEKDNSKTVIVNIDIVDAQGNLVEIADNLITLHYPKQVVLLGTGNGNPSSHENVKIHYRRAFNGRLQAIFSIDENKSAEISVTALGLMSDSVMV